MHGFTPYVVDLDVLARAVGGGDRALVRRCEAKAGRWSRYELDGPTPVEAARTLIDGGEPEEDYAYAYGYGLALLCDVLGESLSNRRWYPCRTALVEAVDEVLAGAGLDPIGPHLDVGPPVALPSSDDLPSVGCMTTDEVRRRVPGLRALVTARPRLDRPVATDVLHALTELHGWLGTASARGQGLVFFYA